MMVMVLRRESKGGGKPSGGTITASHGKDKQFLSLVSSGDKIMGDGLHRFLGSQVNRSQHPSEGGPRLGRMQCRCRRQTIATDL